MNIKNYLLIFVAFIFAASCNKGTVDLTPKDNMLKGSHIEGIYDLTLSSQSMSDGIAGKEKLRLSIIDDSNFHEIIKLSVEGLPANVSATYTPSQKAAPFVSELVFSLNGVPNPGKYALTIKMTNEAGKEMTYSMFLTIPIVDFFVDNNVGFGKNLNDDILIYNDRLSGEILFLTVWGGKVNDTIHLSYYNLPVGVEAIFRENDFPQGSGTYVSFKTTKATPGTYPISLEVVSRSGIRKSYKMNLVIEDECSADKASTSYDFLRYQDGKLIDSIFEYVEIIKDTRGINRLIVSAKNSGSTSNNYIQLQINCTDNTINIINEGNTIIGSNNVTLTGVGSYNPITKDYVLDCTINGYLKSPIILRKK